MIFISLACRTRTSARNAFYPWIQNILALVTLIILLILDVEYLDDPLDEFSKKKKPKKGSSAYKMAMRETNLIKGQIVCVILLAIVASALVLYYLIAFIRARCKNSLTQIEQDQMPMQSKSSSPTATAPPPYDSLVFDTRYQQNIPRSEHRQDYHCPNCKHPVPIHY